VLEHAFKYLEYVDSESESKYYSKPKDQQSSEFKIEELSSDWLINGDNDWTFYSLPNTQFPDQGWKIHITTDYEKAEKTLLVMSRLLIQSKIPFKHIKSKRVLFNMYSKTGDRSSSGKFITIYPKENEFITLLNQAYELVKDFSKGPYILTDKQWKNSNVFYRYGGFKKILNESGEYCIYDNKGNLIPDKRNPSYHVPKFVVVPKELKEDNISGKIKENKLTHYEIKKALRFSNSGGIYIAHRRSDNKKVIIKEARANIGLDGMKKTSVQRLENEHDKLNKLSGVNGIVQAIDFFKVWESTFLVEDFIEGKPLANWLAINYPFSINDDKSKYFKDLKEIMSKLKDILKTMHQKEVAMCDLQTQNILIDEDLNVKIIDFETATELNNQEKSGMATKGFAHPLTDKAYEKDWYALNRIFQYGLLPVGAIYDLDMSLNATHCEWIYNRFGEDAYHYFISFQKECCQYISNSKIIFEGTYDINEKKVNNILSGLVLSLSNSCDGNLEKMIPGDIRQFEFDCGSYNIQNGGFGAILAALRTNSLTNEMKKWIKTQVPIVLNNNFNNGFLTGRAGIACVLNEYDYKEESYTLMNQVLEEYKQDTTDISLRSGLAGIGMGLVAMYQESKNNKYLHEAIEISKKIITIFDSSTEITMTDWESIPLGLLDGYSGASVFLSLLFSVTKNKDHLRYATLLIQKDIESSIVSEEDGVLQIHDKDKNRLLPYLSNGTIGVGVAITVLNNISSSNYFEDEMKSINKVSDYVCCYDSNLFDGAGGFFVTIAFEGSREIDLENAIKRLELFLIQKDKSIDLPGKEFYCLSSDFQTGTAGVILAIKTAQRKNVLEWLPMVNSLLN